MAETRTPNRSQSRPADMRDAGMPQGQAPTVHRPAPQMTAMQRRDAENAKVSEAVRDALIAAVEAKRMEIESFLAVFGITYDLFLAGLMVFLSRQQREQPDFFVNLHVPSFIEALTRIAMNGLMPDGKEAAIAAYKDSSLGGQKVAQPMFMRDGFVKVLWRTGMVKAINDQVVTMKEYETGHFEYEEGDQGFVRHKLDLMRKDVDPVAAAYCVIELVGGGVMREVVPKDELDKMAAKSKSPARKEWQHQMHRKGAIRRIMGKMPREKGIVQLLQHDDETYDKTKLLAAPGIEDEDKPALNAIFGGRPIRRKGRAPHPALEDQDDGAAGDSPQSDPRGQDDTADDIHAEEPPDDQGDGGAADAPEPFVLQAIITTRNGVQQYPPEQGELWFGDLSEKLGRLEADAQRAFWSKNRPYIEEAGRNGYGAFAMKLMERATELGLIHVGGDHDAR